VAVMVPHVEKSAIHIWVVVQVGQEASQTRDYCVAKNATHCAARPDPRQARGRLFAAQRTLAQDDNQTALLPGWGSWLGGECWVRIAEVSNQFRNPGREPCSGQRLPL